MGQINRSLAGGAELTFKDKVYTVSPWTYEIQASYERHLEAEAVRVVRRMVGITDAERRDLLKEVQKDIAAGVYSFGGEVVSQSLKSVNHLKHLLYLMLRKNHPEITSQLVQEMVEEQLDEVMEKITEANADPTMPGPAPETPA